MTSPTPGGRHHLHQLRQAMASFDGCADVAHRWGGLLAETFDRGGRLLAAGNGGSAAQAQHLTAELVGRYRLERAPLSAICLSAETSSLTAIINDYPRRSSSPGRWRHTDAPATWWCCCPPAAAAPTW
ncbi:MAG: SIS domain-containing protein [Nocardioidaceae bacterium]